MGKATKIKLEPGEAPTLEQLSAFERGMVMHAETAKGAAAYRRKPVIDTLLAEGVLDTRRYELLAYYADQASLAEKSPIRSCCDDTPRGGNGPSMAILSAELETGRIERQLGSLRDIARAIAVKNMSLTQWCIEKYGGRERYGKGGRFIAMVPVAEKRNLQLARLDLRMAADRITTGIDFRR